MQIFAIEFCSAAFNDCMSLNWTSFEAAQKTSKLKKVICWTHCKESKMFCWNSKAGGTLGLKCAFHVLHRSCGCYRCRGCYRCCCRCCCCCHCRCCRRLAMRQSSWLSFSNWKYSAPLKVSLVRASEKRERERLRKRERKREREEKRERGKERERKREKFRHHFQRPIPGIGNWSKF